MAKSIFLIYRVFSLAGDFSGKLYSLEKGNRQ